MLKNKRLWDHDIIISSDKLTGFKLILIFFSSSPSSAFYVTWFIKKGKINRGLPRAVRNNRGHTCIRFSGKFVPIFKKNSNAAHLNFGIRLNYIGAILFHNLSVPFTQLEYSILSELLRFLDEKIFNMVFYVDQRVKAFTIKGIL